MNTERAFLWSGNPQLDPEPSFATDVQQGHVFRLRLCAENRVPLHTLRTSVCSTSWAPKSHCTRAATLRLCRGTSGAPCQPRRAPGQQRARLCAWASLGSVSHSVQVHRRDRGRLLAYKPALKQWPELQVSGSEQLRCVTTSQLSHGNRLLPARSRLPTKAGANTPSHTCARGREHTGSPLLRLGRSQEHTNCCGKVRATTLPPNRLTASIKQRLCPSLPSWGILGLGRAASERNGSFWAQRALFTAMLLVAGERTRFF